jgi:hypothetical protein
MTIKPGHQTAIQLETPDMVRSVVLHAIPYIRKSLRLENTQGSLQSVMPGCNSETRGGSVMVWAAISWYSILLVPLLLFMTELLQGGYVDKLGN